MSEIKYPLFKVFMSDDVLEPVCDVLKSGYLTQGPKVEQFESDLRTFFDHPYVLTLNSATSGLTLALRLLMKPDLENGWPGIDPNTDEVLTTALTCTATNWPILANGLRLRWVDVDPSNCGMCLRDLEEKMTDKTKVIMVVHWGGYPIDLDELNAVLDRAEERFGFRARVIEDCAHAFGAEFNGKKIGTHGNMCVFSLQAIKHLTTGDGGLLLVPNSELYERGRVLRWYGIDREKRNYKGKDFRLENDVEEWGYKFHMNDLTATIGIYNLPHMAKLLKTDRQNGYHYDRLLKDIKGINLMENQPNCESSFWLYSLRVLHGHKEEFMKKMTEKGIMVSQVHNRNDVHTCVRQFQEPLQILDHLEKELVCIPVGWWMSTEDIEYVATTIREIMTELTNSS